MRRKEPLYRSVNTRTHGVRHPSGEYRWSRRRDDHTGQGAMHGKTRRGRDYTPLFRFLLSHVGDDWDAVHAEAVSRLDSPEPIFWIVALTESERKPIVLIGESTFFSGLYVDDANRLALVDPDLRIERLKPGCACCTHTFNGKPFVLKYQDDLV